ncbi:hypothetical protein NC652_001596 [Populus alba x Populus x berolinensis]|nr:hypothetical protein NC652_001596 [Populus alba x Populus x berolinensis]
MLPLLHWRTRADFTSINSTFFPSLSGGNKEEKSTSFCWAVVMILENRSSRGSKEGSPVAEM